MTRVVLRTGKVIVYNTAESMKIESGAFALRTRDEKYLIARVPVDIVERIEFVSPCSIYRERKPKFK